MNQPFPGQIWQHFKHTPETPHQYLVISVTTPGALPANVYPYYTVVHTETGELMDLIVSFSENGHWLNPPQAEPFVVYRDVQNEMAIWWARPLSSFIATDSRSPTGQKFWLVSGE
jgi:hypothetical protein